MVSTEIVNGTEGSLTLKEGNAGVYRDIKLLPPKKKHVIQIDPNATYREYAVVSSPGPGGDKVFITSDDCIDNARITIVLKNGKHDFDGQARGVEAKPSPEEEEQQQQPAASGSGLVPRWIKKFWSPKPK